MPASPPPTRDDIRELEARVDARFQAVSARFVRVDNRFAEVGTRLDEADHRHRALVQQLDNRFDDVDTRFDSTSAQIAGVSSKVDRVGRMMLMGFGATAVLTASLWFSTVTAVT